MPNTNKNITSVQSVEKDWPLYLVDNEGGQHKVFLEPGEMVWYESARILHGRPQPFQGQFFDILTVHYR